MKRYIAAFIYATSVSVAAQQGAPAKTPLEALATVKRQTAPPDAPRPEVDPLRGQVINIRLDVSVLDQTDGAATAPKTVMVLLADRAIGRTRGAFEDRYISVDATPRIVDGRIRVQLTVDSRGHLVLGKQPEQTLIWQNSFELVLDSGKPMTAFETTDPVTKRKLSIEVKATIQK